MPTNEALGEVVRFRTDFLLDGTSGCRVTAATFGQAHISRRTIGSRCRRFVDLHRRLADAARRRRYPLAKVSEKAVSGSAVGCEEIRAIALANCADERPPGWSSARRPRSSMDTMPER